MRGASCSSMAPRRPSAAFSRSSSSSCPCRRGHELQRATFGPRSRSWVATRAQPRRLLRGVQARPSERSTSPPRASTRGGTSRRFGTAIWSSGSDRPYGQDLSCRRHGRHVPQRTADQPDHPGASAVEGGEARIPAGDLAEKVIRTSAPLRCVVRPHDRDQIERLLAKGTIEVAPLAFMRGGR